MYLQKVIRKNNFLLTSWRSLRKTAGSGSISQRYGSADPDLYQYLIDPQHWYKQYFLFWHRNTEGLLAPAAQSNSAPKPEYWTGLPLYLPTLVLLFSGSVLESPKLARELREERLARTRPETRGGSFKGWAQPAIVDSETTIGWFTQPANPTANFTEQYEVPGVSPLSLAVQG